MTVIEWPSDMLGDMFSDAKLSLKENIVQVKYESGRTVSCQANGRQLKKMSVKVQMSVKQGQKLLEWISTSLASGAYAFHSPILDVGGKPTAWTFESMPSTPLAGRMASIELSLVEAYV